MNDYFTFTWGSTTKRFRAISSGLSVARRKFKTVQYGISGNTLVTNSTANPRTITLSILIKSSDADPYGTIVDLRNAYAADTVTYTDFDGTTSFTAIFDSDLVERNLDPLRTVMIANVKILEVLP